MLDYKKNCAVCKLIKQTPRIADEIYKTTAYDKTSKVSLKAFQRIYSDKFSYTSLLNHTRKHQGLSAEDLSQRHLNKIVKNAEKNLLLKKIEASNVWDTVMTIGHEGIESGDIKLTASDVLRASKDKTDYHLKVKDQEMAMAEMVYHFASGSNAPIGSTLTEERIHADAEREGTSSGEPASSDKTITSGSTTEQEAGADLDFTEESAVGSVPGSDGSSGVYYPPTWDASS